MATTVSRWSHGFVLFGLMVASVNSLAQVSAKTPWKTLNGEQPLVIGHRGAPGYRPDHTLASYELAIQFGADFIEPDLVATKDGQLIARHEPLLDATTDVSQHPEFAARKTTRTMDGKSITGFYASDFTLQEIKTLRAVQPIAARSKEYDGKFEIPTFEEILQLLDRTNARRAKPIGVYPETKHPSFHLALGLSLEDRLLDALRKHHLEGATAPVFIQSFESANLQYLRGKTQTRQVQLMDDGALLYDASGKTVTGVAIPDWGDKRGGTAPKTLADIALYANAIGPYKRQILVERSGLPLMPTTVIDQAHAAGLLVHTYTFRNEPATLAPEYHNDPLLEYRQIFSLGVDGVFSDFADTALEAREQFGRGN